MVSATTVNNDSSATAHRTIHCDVVKTTIHEHAPTTLPPRTSPMTHDYHSELQALAAECERMQQRWPATTATQLTTTCNHPITNQPAPLAHAKDHDQCTPNAEHTSKPVTLLTPTSTHTKACTPTSNGGSMPVQCSIHSDAANPTISSPMLATSTPRPPGHEL